jgi:DNA-binding NtrC family response regulator
VRELRNVVERLLLLTDDAVDVGTVRQVLSGKPAGVSAASASSGRGTLAERVTAFEREVMLEQLAAHGYRVAETARALGLERSHLYKKCQQLGIDVKTERAQPSAPRDE